MNNQNKFDQYLEGQMDHYPESFDPADWSGVEKKLPQGGKRKVFFWWYFLLIPVSIYAGVEMYTFQAKPGKAIIMQDVMHEYSPINENIKMTSETILESPSPERTISTPVAMVIQGNAITKPDANIEPASNTEGGMVSEPIFAEAMPPVDIVNEDKKEMEADDIYHSHETMEPVSLNVLNINLPGTIPKQAQISSMAPTQSLTRKKPKYHPGPQNELFVYGAASIARFDLYNQQTGSNDKNVYLVRGLGMEYQRKLNKRFTLGLGAGFNEYNIKDQVGGKQERMVTKTQTYQTLDIDIVSGKLYTKTITEKTESTLYSHYKVDRRTNIVQGNISASLNYCLLKGKNLELGVGLLERYTLSKVNAYQYQADSGFGLTQTPVFKYTSETNNYHTSGVLLDVKCRIYKQAYLRFQPAFLVNAKMNDKYLNPSYMWSNQLGLSYKF